MTQPLFGEEAMYRVVRPDETVSEVIGRAIADATSRHLDDLQPIGESVDTDAIEALFAGEPDDGPEHLVFRHEGCRVTVYQTAITVNELSGDDGEWRPERLPPRRKG